MKLKKITHFALALLFSMPAVSYAHKLESTVLKFLDGKVIDGPTYGQIKKYLLDLRALLIGKLQSGKRVGHFIYNEKPYTVKELVKLENEMSDDQRTALLGHMREHFEEFSAPFQQSVKNVKGFLRELIKQSSQIREREDNLLLKWADPAIDDDHALFDAEVKTINDFSVFLTDLHNFLIDLTESCPQGKAEFDLLMQKVKDQAKN